MGGVPPKICADAVPSAQVPQDAFAELMLMLSNPGCVNINGAELLQPVESVTVTVYVPEAMFCTQLLVSPVDHKYVTGLTFAVAQMEPSVPPEQPGDVVVDVITIAAGSVIITTETLIQPVVSVTVTV